MRFGLSGVGGQAVVAALVVATNMAPMAGLDGLADYTGAAACALATGSDRPDLACRAGAPATDPAAADTATDRAAATGDNRAYRDTAAAPPGVVADRRPADCPRTSPMPDGPGTAHDAGGGSSADTAEDARVTTTATVDEARDEDGESDRRRRDTDDAGDNPSRHPPVVHERDDDGQDSSGDDADTPGPALRAAAAPSRVPGDLIDLADWYLTLPTGKAGDPDTVENPDLEKFTNAFFTLNDARDGVVFSARGDGVTTKNSHYPRSELREMNGSAKAAWSNTRGTHTLDVCEAITQVPSGKPEVVAAQIHDDKDDVLQIRLEGRKLIVQYDDGKAEQVLDPAYRLGTPYHVRIDAADSTVDVLYNGEKKAELPLTGSGWYWKVGAYVQANSDTGDAQSTGAVTVYALQVNHSDAAGGSTDDAGTSRGAGPTSSSPAADKGASDKTDDEQDGAGRSDTPTTSESSSGY
jgi:hypothetical protein